MLFEDTLYGYGVKENIASEIIKIIIIKTYTVKKLWEVILTTKFL